MPSNTFISKIKQELKQLNKEQIVNFTWRCAVRALPYLGGKGNFIYWKKKDRQKHLYAVFYALDSAIADVTADADATADVADAADAAYVPSARAARAATDAAYSAFKVAATIDARTIYHPAAAAADTTYASNRYGIDLENIIIQDLNHIKNNGGREQENTLEL